MQYRARVRGFELEKLEQIVLHSTERYHDSETGRPVVIGHYGKKLVIVPMKRLRM